MLDSLSFALVDIVVDLEILKKCGIDPEGLKKKFNLPPDKRSDKINGLIDRMRNRCQGGRDLNLENYHIYKAIDDSFDTSMKQISPTLLSSIADKAPDDPSVLDILKQIGMDPKRIIQEVPDPKTPGKNMKFVSVSALHEVFVPLVKSYITIRWAKLVNDRRMDPLFRFDPVVNDEVSRLRCSAITARVATMSRQMNYFETMKQLALRMLLYGDQVQFPMEEWYQECQCIEPSDNIFGEDVKIKDADGKEFKARKVVVKEGIRYHLPHPTRTYKDHAHWPTTMNSDTGCQYAGYWRVMRWGDLLDAPGFYNLDRVGYQTWDTWYGGRRSHGYWTNALKGCTLNFPAPNSTADGGGKFDSEKSLSNWYSRDFADKDVVITTHFERLIPKDYDLGPYEYPVWFRFVLAADDNVIYAAPCGFTPLIWYGYDWAEGRTHNASMALEVLPFQDQFSNLMAQYLLTIRQNLMNLSFVDTDLLDEAEIQELENRGEKFWRKINIFRKSFKKSVQKLNSTPERAVVSHKFPYQDSTSLLNGMKVILDTLERVLVMSAQEVGQAASHEQTREEIRHINSNTSTRVVFTGISLDQGIDAWKKQLYQGLMAYGQPEFYAQVAMDEPMDETKLDALGFTMGGKYDEKTRKAYLKVKKTAIAYESFSSDRDGDMRINNAELAQACVQLLDTALKYPQVQEKINGDQLVQMVNQIARLAGLPNDFRLISTNAEAPMQQQLQQAIEMLQQQLTQTLEQKDSDLRGALSNIMGKNQEQDVNLKEIAATLNQLIGMTTGVQPPQLSEGAPEQAVA